MSSIDLSHSVPQRMPIEAAAISFQICKITILMFCDTIDNMHSLLYPRGEDEQQQKKRQWSMAVCDCESNKVRAFMCSEDCIGHWTHQQQHQSHRECFPSASPVFFVQWYAPHIKRDQTMDQQNIHFCRLHRQCAHSNWKWTAKNERKKNKSTHTHTRAKNARRWNNKMKLTTTRKHDDKRDPTKLFMFYNK